MDSGTHRRSRVGRASAPSHTPFPPFPPPPRAVCACGAPALLPAQNAPTRPCQSVGAANLRCYVQFDMRFPHITSHRSNAIVLQSERCDLTSAARRSGTFFLHAALAFHTGLRRARTARRPGSVRAPPGYDRRTNRVHRESDRGQRSHWMAGRATVPRNVLRTVGVLSGARASVVRARGWRHSARGVRCRAAPTTRSPPRRVPVGRAGARERWEGRVGAEGGERAARRASAAVRFFFARAAGEKKVRAVLRSAPSAGAGVVLVGAERQRQSRLRG